MNRSASDRKSDDDEGRTADSLGEGVGFIDWEVER